MEWNLRRIDDLNRDEHEHLEEGDHCYYFLEYTRERGYAYSNANSFILNLKKSVTKYNLPDYGYKATAIDQAAKYLEQALRKGLDKIVMVPVPPSKTKGHPEYDDRMTRVLERVQELAKKQHINAQILELVWQTADRAPGHSSYPRTDEKSIDALAEIYETMSPKEAEPILADKEIVIVDDMLTCGTHFKAMQHVIAETYQRNIIGVFLSRRINPE